MDLFQSKPMPIELAEILKDPELTRKQRRFILAYLKYLTGSKAARVAGYSVKCAHQQAYENMRKPKISRIIDKGIELNYCAWAVDPAVVDDVGGKPDKCQLMLDIHAGS